jgi:hypothetical protein
MNSGPEIDNSDRHIFIAFISNLRQMLEHNLKISKEFFIIHHSDNGQHNLTRSSTVLGEGTREEYAFFIKIKILDTYSESFIYKSKLLI